VIFVDTGAWFAASVPTDSDHHAAARFLAQNTQPLLLSDFIYGELLTLFRARRQMARARIWLNQVEQQQCTVVRATDADLQDAAEVFLQFSDKR
jgi:predicted nucleic acid-binding protein